MVQKKILVKCEATGLGDKEERDEEVDATENGERNEHAGHAQSGLKYQY